MHTDRIKTEVYRFLNKVFINKNEAQGIHSGTTAERPDISTVPIGYEYFDTTINSTIWSNGTTWILIPNYPPDASTTVKGLAEIATQTEVNTGTDSIRYIVPSTLKSRLSIIENFRTIRSSVNKHFTFFASDIDKIIEFTFSADNTGTSTIPVNTFVAGDILMGFNSGTIKEFIGGTDGIDTVNIRYPSYGTKILQPNETFKIRFLSANDVILEIDDIGAKSYFDLTDTTDTNYTDKAFFIPSVSAFETGITLENPAIFRPVFTINDTTGSAWTASAIGDAVQLIRIVDAGGGTLAGAAGMEFKKLTIMNESASTFTLLHEDSGTTATDRFNFADSNDLVLPVNGWVDLMYVNGRYRRGL